MLCAGVMGGLRCRWSSDRSRFAHVAYGLCDWLKLGQGSNVGLFGCFKEVCT